MPFEPRQRCLRGHTAYIGDFDAGRNVCKFCTASERSQRGRSIEYNSLRSRRRAKLLLRTAEVRARKRGLAFDLCESDVQSRIDKGVCERTGIAFDMEARRAWNVPSLDRIDPSGGYTRSNVRIILFALNSALGNWGEEVLFQIVKAMTNDAV